MLLWPTVSTGGDDGISSIPSVSKADVEFTVRIPLIASSGSIQGSTSSLTYSGC